MNILEKSFDMDPAFLCKVFFTLGTVVDMGGCLIPSFRQNIMNYGSRSSIISRRGEVHRPKSQLAKLFYFIASLRVPHSWFIHYYLISVVSSVFWAIQMTTHGRAFEYIASHTQQTTPGMSINQVLWAWCLMTTQGTRRLYECITLTKRSQSTMWVGIWLLGIAYYIFMGMSIWIEGIS